MITAHTLKALVVLVAVMAMTACVNNRAVRVRCDGALEPLNVPAILSEKDNNAPRS